MIGAIEAWGIPAALAGDPMITCAEAFAARHAGSSLETILDLYVGYPTAEAAADELGRILDLAPMLHGRGIEVGAGVAVFSATAARRAVVREVVAVEAVAGVVERLQARVVPAVAGSAAEKIRPVIGDFDAIRAADGSFDFALALDALHHSQDMARTLAELARVLRPGAALIVADRAHHDDLSEAQRRFMLDVVYSPEFLERNGFPPGRMTRRDNGENEWRMSEWCRWLDEAGFAIDRHAEMRITGARRALRSAALLLPFALRRRIGILPSRARPHPGEMAWRLGLRAGGFLAGRHDYSIFVCRRR